VSSYVCSLIAEHVLNVVVCSKLEADVKRLKSELQSSRCLEQELRSQIASLSFSDRTTKSELYQLRQENESLQSKYVSLQLVTFAGSRKCIIDRVKTLFSSCVLQNSSSFHAYTVML